MQTPNGHRFLFTHSQNTTPEHVQTFLDCVNLSISLFSSRQFNLCLVTNFDSPVIDFTEC